MGYVDEIYKGDKDEQVKYPDFVSYGIYDVLGTTKPEDDPNPGMGSDNVPFLNIEDPTWGTEQYPGVVKVDPTKPNDSKKEPGRWATDPLVLGLPVVNEKPLTCEDKCVLASKKRIAACNTLRARVQDALAKAGCPCEITGRDKVSSCGTTMTGLSARYSRNRRGRRLMRSRTGRRRFLSRSRPRRSVSNYSSCASGNCALNDEQLGGVMATVGRVIGDNPIPDEGEDDGEPSDRLIEIDDMMEGEEDELE